MHSLVDSHVIADEDDLAREPLRREVKRLKPSVSSPSDNSGLGEQNIVAVAAALDALDFGEMARTVRVLRDFEAGKAFRAIVEFPPSEVAPVKDVGPRRELP